MQKYFLAITSLLSLFSVLVVAGEAKSTGDWDRRAEFVRPEAAEDKIIDSWSGGRWSEKGISGTFRFVIAEYKPGKEKLYVQWLTDNEVAYSLSVKEINARPEYDLELPKCLDGDACQRVAISATHYYEKTTRVFNMSLQHLGSYIFKL